MINTESQNYKKNFLTNVILRIDFPKILGLEKNPPVELQEVIKDTYPIIEENKILNLNQKYWLFYNREKKKKLEFSFDYFVVEYLNYYKDFQEFTNDYLYGFKLINEIYKINILNRIGLRYINQIIINKGNPFVWKELINKNLTSITDKFVQNKENVIRSMHLLETKEDIYNMRMQFGLFNSEYPNKISRKEFILDFDCFLKDNVDTSELQKVINSLHDLIIDKFENCIEFGLRNIMKEA